MPNFKAVGQHLKDYAFVYPSITATGGMLLTNLDPKRKAAYGEALGKGVTSELKDYVITDKVKDTLSKTTDAIPQAVASKVGDAVVDSGKKLYDQASTWVGKNPWQTAGLVGTAVGVPILAKLLSNYYADRNDANAQLERAKKRLQAAKLDAQTNQLKVAFSIPKIGPKTLTAVNTLGLGVGAAIPATYAGVRAFKAYSDPNTSLGMLASNPEELASKVGPVVTDTINQSLTPDKIKEIAGSAAKGIIEQPITNPTNWAAGLGVTVLGSILAKRVYDRWATSATDKKQKELLQELDAKTASDFRRALVGAGVGTLPLALNTVSGGTLQGDWSAGYDNTPMGTMIGGPIAGALTAIAMKRMPASSWKYALKGAGAAGLGYGTYAGIDPSGAGKLMGHVGGKAGLVVADAVPHMSSLMHKRHVSTIPELTASGADKLVEGLNKIPGKAYDVTAKSMQSMGDWAADHKWQIAGGTAVAGLAPILLYNLLSSKSKSELTDKLIDKAEAKRKRLEA